jgi:lipopolysaccharide export system protein LptA
MLRQILLTVALSLSAALAAGEKSPGASFGDFTFTSRKEPIQVTAEHLDFDYKNRRTVFRGGVEVTQGDIHMLSNVLTVDYSETGGQQQLREVTAEGNVTITQGPRKGTGDRAVFDQSTRTLVLTGNAVLEEGSNQVNGDTIVVYPDESRMEVKGENRRVKVILFPGQGSLAKTPAAAEGEVAKVPGTAGAGTPTNGPTPGS